MKTIILLILLLFSIHIKAQHNKVEQFTFDAIYVSYQPVDFGFGIRADYHLGSIPIYNSISYGDGALYRNYDMRDHYKFTMGIGIPMKDYLNNEYKFNAGINYHKLGSIMIENIPWDTHLFNPFSFELGIAVYCWGNFALAIRTDILRWEPCLDIGWAF